MARTVFSEPLTVTLDGETVHALSFGVQWDAIPVSFDSVPIGPRSREYLRPPPMHQTLKSGRQRWLFHPPPLHGDCTVEIMHSVIDLYSGARSKWRSNIEYEISIKGPWPGNITRWFRARVTDIEIVSDHETWVLYLYEELIYD